MTASGATARSTRFCDVYPRIGYTAPNGRQMAERNFVELDDGTFRRHPSRQLFENAFAVERFIAAAP